MHNIKEIKNYIPTSCKLFMSKSNCRGLIKNAALHVFPTDVHNWCVSHSNEMFYLFLRASGVMCNLMSGRNNKKKTFNSPQIMGFRDASCNRSKNFLNMRERL